MVECQTGENWHEFVLWTINQNFGGLENMSLIPGNVGTTPYKKYWGSAEIKTAWFPAKLSQSKSNYKNLY
jgi:UDP-N-acetylmuramate dehydrogenase